jgi:hypothetical protein
LREGVCSARARPTLKGRRKYCGEVRGERTRRVRREEGRDARALVAASRARDALFLRRALPPFLSTPALHILSPSRNLIARAHTRPLSHRHTHARHTLVYR